MSKPKIIVVYQPHQNIRQHFPKILEGYLSCFDYADKVYWLPTFLSRENNLPILSPQEILIKSKIWSKSPDNCEFQNTDSKTKNKTKQDKPKKLEKNSKSEDKLAKKFEISELDQNLAKKLAIHKQNNDLIIFMGAGNIDNWAKNWLK